MDEKSVRLILAAVSRAGRGALLTFEDIRRMKDVTISSTGGTVIHALQKGRTTILVRNYDSPDGTDPITDVQFVDW